MDGGVRIRKLLYGSLGLFLLLLTAYGLIVPSRSQLRRDLEQALLNKNEQQVLDLLERGADPNVWPAGSGLALSLKMSPRVFRALVAAGAEPKYDSGLISAAMATEDFAKIKMVLEAGADANGGLRGGDGYLPLHKATAAGDVELARLLLKHGAWVDDKSMQPLTPLLVLAKASGRMEPEKAVETARVLLQSGADINAKGYSGTPLRVARLAGNSALAKFLEDRGGKE